MPFRTVFAEVIPEKSSARITADLKDEAGAALGSAALNTLTLTLYNKADLAIINAVDGTNILNTGRGSISAGGTLTLTLDPADSPIVATSAPLEEKHLLLLQFTYGAGGAKAGRHEIEVTVRNLDKVS
jgi:hypothetical protein